MNLYSWDEVEGQIHKEEVTEDDSRFRDFLGYEWRYYTLLPNNIVVLKADNYWALEVWANSVSDAHQRFMTVKQYADTQ